MLPTLFIVCGLPGSGKTTHARKLEAEKHAIRFCADEWMDQLSINLWDEKTRGEIEALQWKVGQELLENGVSMIIEWGTWGKGERDILRTRAKELGARVELHYLSASADVLFERIQKRGMENPPIKREDVNHWFEVFQVPNEEEIALYDRFYLLMGR